MISAVRPSRLDYAQQWYVRSGASHTNPTRQRGQTYDAPSLARQVSVRRYAIQAGWAGGLCCWLCLLVPAAQALDGKPSNSGNGDDVVVVSLRPTLLVGERELCVADVATLDGGDEQLRDQ